MGIGKNIGNSRNVIRKIQKLPRGKPVSVLGKIPRSDRARSDLRNNFILTIKCPSDDDKTLTLRLFNL